MFYVLESVNIMADKFLNGSLEDEITYARCLNTMARLPMFKDLGENNVIMQDANKRAEILLAAAKADPSIARSITEISQEKLPNRKQFVQDTLYLMKKRDLVKESSTTISSTDSSISAKVKLEHE